MIASVKLPNDDAQVDATRYDSDRGGKERVDSILHTFTTLLVALSAGTKTLKLL